MEQKKKTSVENEAAEHHNLKMAGGLHAEKTSDLLHQYMNETGQPMPDLYPAIENARKEWKRARPPRRLKRPAAALIVMLALLLAGFTGYMIYELQRSDYDTHSEFRTLESADESQLAYIISELPTGFFIETVTDISGGKEARYKNKDGDLLIFNYASDDLTFNFDNETEQETVTLHPGIEARLFSKGDYRQITWRYEDSVLSITGTLSREQIIESAKSVVSQ